MLPIGVFLLGPAGAGKTSLVSKLIELAETQEVDSVGVNLDPGCVNIPFRYIFDARTISTVNEILSQGDVGPNFAMVEAFNRIINHRDKLYFALKKVKKDIIFFDTPGQMEVFLFHPEIPTFLKEVSHYVKPVGVFILDNNMVKDVVKLVVTEFLSLNFEMHLSLPLVTVINKADLGVPEDIDKLITDTDYLIGEVKKTKLGLEKDLILGLIPMIRSVRGVTRIICTSTKTGKGIDDLFNLIHEFFCVCGDIS
ncbi:MAG: ATP/GTP-binding protein [Candidatus Odinarchaeia archaeon]